MSGGIKMVADTNIILFCNKGDKQAFSIIQDNNIYISAITEIELLGYKGITAKERKILKSFLDDLTIIAVNERIKNYAIDLRVQYGLKRQMQ